MLASLRNGFMKHQWSAGSDLCIDPDLACGVQSSDLSNRLLRFQRGNEMTTLW